jgi:hypothetical protein
MRRFAAEYRYNDGAHALLAGFLGGSGARVAVLALLLMAGAFVFRSLRRDGLKATEHLALLLGLFVLLSPTVHPWYGTWVAPATALLAGRRANLPWLALSIGAGLGYGIYLFVRPGDPWRELPLALRLLVHLPPWILLAASIVPRSWTLRRAVSQVREPATDLTSTVR